MSARRSSATSRRRGYVAPVSTCRVMTPFPIADAIVRALGESGSETWLEPSHGDGVFLKALAGMKVPARRVWATDLHRSRRPNDRYAQVVRGVDFLGKSWPGRDGFDRIVGNPPFVAIERLHGYARKVAAETIDPDGNPIGANANTWYAFVCRAIQLLRAGGHLGMVLPASAEFASYCSGGRSCLPELFEEIGLYRVKKSPFGQVQDGNVVLIAKGYHGGKRLTTTCYQRVEVEESVALVERLRSTARVRSRRCRPAEELKQGEARVSDLARIGIGAVTGDAKYFLLSEERRKELGLPVGACRFVLTRAQHLRRAVIERDTFTALRTENKRVLLFRPPPSLEDHPRVQAYLRRPVVVGGCRRKNTKVQSRQCWYRTVMPLSPDGFLSGMSSHELMVTLNRCPGLSATNTLYVVRMLGAKPESSCLNLAIALLSQQARKQVAKKRRWYSGGLLKIEPGDLADVIVPWPVRSPSIAKYLQATERFKQGAVSDGVRIIESMI